MGMSDISEALAAIDPAAQQAPSPLPPPPPGPAPIASANRTSGYTDQIGSLLDQYNTARRELDRATSNPDEILFEDGGMWWRADSVEYTDQGIIPINPRPAKDINLLQSRVNDAKFSIDELEGYKDAGLLQTGGGGSGGGSAGAFLDTADIAASEGDRAYNDYISRVGDIVSLNQANFDRERAISDAFKGQQDYALNRASGISEGLLTPWAPRMGFRPPAFDPTFQNFANDIGATVPERAPAYVPYNGPSYVPRGFAGGTLSAAFQPPQQPMQVPPQPMMAQPQQASMQPPMNPPPMEPDLQGKIAMGPAGMTAQQRLQRYTNARA